MTNIGGASKRDHLYWKELLVNLISVLGNVWNVNILMYHAVFNAVAIIMGVGRDYLNQGGVWNVSSDYGSLNGSVILFFFSSVRFHCRNLLVFVLLGLQYLMYIHTHLLIFYFGVLPGAIYYHGLILIPAWIIHHMPGKLWDEMAYQFLTVAPLKFGKK